MKKILSFLVVVALIFVISGCASNDEPKKYNTGKNQEIIYLVDDQKGYNTTFENINGHFKVVDEDQELEDLELSIQNKTLNVGIEMFYLEETSSEYNDEKSEYEDINDYSWNGFKGYSYDSQTDLVRFKIIMEEKDDNLIVITGNVYSLYSNKDTNVEELFEGDEVQKFLSSIKYNK